MAGTVLGMDGFEGCRRLRARTAVPIVMLRLAVVKELNEAIGGTVSVRSAPGKGVTFTVRLPQAAEPAHEGPGEATEATAEGPQESAEPERSKTSPI